MAQRPHANNSYWSTMTLYYSAILGFLLQMRYTHRPGFCSWMQWFFFFSSGGSLSSLFQCSGGTSSLLSSLFSLIEWVWRRTAGLWMYAREGKTEERREGQPIPTPYSPPARPSSAPRPPLVWLPRMKIPGLRPKFQNSKCVQLNDRTTAYRFTHTHMQPTPLHTHIWTSHTHTQAETPPGFI